MSSQITPVPEHVCYVHCNFCNTILAVNCALAPISSDPLALSSLLFVCLF
jgi:hypothetical protein